MRKFALFIAFPGILLFANVSFAQSATKKPSFDIHRPTVVAFFSPVTKSDLNGSETNESLSDFQFYAGNVRLPLEKAGVDFHVVYAPSFQIRINTKTTTFRPTQAKVGYYIAAPGKRPRIEYGVMTDTDLLQVADKYFGLTTPTQ